jgi:hypothetical protein
MNLFFFFFLLHAQKALLADSKSFFFFFFNLEKIIKNSLFPPFPFLNYNAIQNSGTTLAFLILLKKKKAFSFF